MERFTNLARMARDILAVQGGSVGVELVFSMARDVIPYRRSSLKSCTIRSSMLVRFHENQELRRGLAGHDSEHEAEQHEEMPAAEDYRYCADRKKESIENDNGCISDDDKLVSVTGRGRAGFHSPDPALTQGRGYVSGNSRPAPVRGPLTLIPWTALFVTT